MVVDSENGRLLLGVTDDELDELAGTEVAKQELAVDSPISIYVNLVDATSGPMPEEAGVVGVGLYRSEFLLSRYGGFPSESRQYREYRSLCEQWASAPVTVRTFDIGGEKEFSFG